MGGHGSMLLSVGNKLSQPTKLARRSTMPEPTLPNKMLALCEMTTECRNGRCQKHPDCVGGCKGTGRVSLLDPSTPEHPDGEFGLRVKCSQCFGDGKQRQLKVGGMALAGAWYETESVDAPCPTCQGRGWTLTTDLWAYVWMSGPHLSYTDAVKLGLLVMDGIKTGIDPGQAAFDVLWEALKAVRRRHHKGRIGIREAELAEEEAVLIVGSDHAVALQLAA